MAKPEYVTVSRENLLFTYKYEKIKAQISCAVTAQLISAFVFATSIESYLFFINPKFQAFTHLLSLYSSICVELIENPEDRFSRDATHVLTNTMLLLCSNTIIFVSRRNIYSDYCTFSYH